MNPKDKKEEINWFLYFAVVIANLTTLTLGTQISWTSSSLEKLKSNSSTENPLEGPITISEASIVTSLLAMGSFCGTPLVAVCLDKIGRKRTLILGSSLIFIAYALIGFATKLWHIYLARFTAGVFRASVIIIIPIYVSEISQKHNRGFYVAFLGSFVDTGKLLMYSLGPYVSLQISALVTLIPTCVFLFFYTIFIPESPYYLIAKGRLEDARGSLKKFRRNYEEKELEEMRNFVAESFKNNAGVLDLFKNKVLLQTLLLSMALLFFQQFSGILAIVSYLQGIFNASHSTLPPEICAIIVGIVQLLSSFIPTFLVDRYGRRLLLITSSLLSSLALTALGASFMIESPSFAWLPLGSVIVFQIAFNLGLGPITFVVLGELFPPHVKGVATSVSISVWCIFTMLTMFLFPLLSQEIGEGPTIWCFAFSCAASAIFGYSKLPETKGKSLSEIYEELNKR